MTSLSEGLKEVYDLWDGLRQGRDAPSFDEMLPATLGKASENMAVIAVEGNGAELDFKFIAVGFTLAERFAGAVYGQKVSEMADEYLRDALRDRYQKVVREKAAMFGKGDRKLDHVPHSYEALTLPLIDPQSGEVTHLISTVLYFTGAEYRERFGEDEDTGPVEISDEG